MRILIHGINFHPEPTGIGKYSGDMAASLVAMGHQVRVVAAPPYYPDWRLCEDWSNSYGRHTWSGVDVWRIPLWVPAQPSGLKRIFHLLSFSIAALPVLALQLFWRPQVVMVVAPALTSAPGGWLTARLSGGRAWLHVQDFEVDAAFELGLINGNGLMRKVITGIEHWLLQRFDRVSTISWRMLDRAKAKGVERERLVFLPNWVGDQAVDDYVGTRLYRQELDIPEDAVVALFSGTLGGKQGLDLLPEVARLIACHPRLVMVICGDGVMKPHLEAACEGMDNVRMLPLQPAERLAELLHMADIHLLPQNPGAADLVMPSKLSGMLGSGRPVVTTAEAGTELAHAVMECGRVVPPGNARSFAQALIDLAEQPRLRAELGAKANEYARKHLVRSVVLGRLNMCLQACTDHTTAGVELPLETTQTSGRSG
ncbi:glycosyltransferase WbuB [Sphaerotilus sp.]|uniref:glycosyltransferase WbuB n=1 Tax=Sphaerotilus sp. TaxID=2093942 RepID=UPI00286E009E|nr:glycosyltransferase WbuB [Sphaerotilus sp.]